VSDLPLLGFGLPVSGSWATPGTMVRIAQMAEELGYASLWTFQRLLSPVVPAHAPQNPASRGADDPAYLSVHDAVLPLAYVAARTQRIRLGTATVCAPFVPPAVLAKEMATLDHLAGGRLDIGVGIGWMPEEHAAAGVAFERRGARMDEYLRCLTALWTQDPVEFHGEFYDVPLSHVGPRPLQAPHPPVLVGGGAPEALRRAGRLAQGWIASTGQGLDGLERGVEQVRMGAREAGRDEDAVRVVVRCVPDLLHDHPGPARRAFQGTREQVLADIAALHARGATEVFADLNFHPRVGSPYVDAAAATAEAERVLHALRPGAA